MIKRGIHLVIVAVMAIMLGAIAVPGTVAAAEGKGCSIIGSWYGYGPDGLINWIVNVQGPSQSYGTNNIESLVFDYTMGGAFDAVKGTNLRGVWERTGGNTFSITMIGYAVNAENVPVWLGKMSGNVTLVDDCNEEELTLTMEIFAPDQDPFTDVPAYGGGPLPFHEGYRMRVDPPYQN